MKFQMRFIFLLALGCWIGPAGASAQYVVGNAGEGILENGRLYVRELYERDLKEQISFEKTILPEIGDRVERSHALPLSLEEKKLLAQKLSAIEMAFPCGGILLLNAMEKYNWVFTQNPLTLHPERDAIRHFPDSVRVQIANRYYLSINVHQASWDLLNSPHRVALVLHELFYGLSVVPLYSDEPSLGEVREVVGTLFLKGIQKDSPLVKTISGMLGLEKGPFCVAPPGGVSLRILDVDNDPDSAEATMSFQLQKDRTQIPSLLKNFCSKFQTFPENYTLNMNLESAHSLAVRFLPYQTLAGNRQYRLAIKQQPPVRFWYYRFKSIKGCAAELFREMKLQESRFSNDNE